jgi:hypothetical protein
MDDLDRTHARTLLQEHLVLTGNTSAWKDHAIINNLLDLEKAAFNNRVHFLYVIDPYDIISYCYPLGFRMQYANMEGSELDKISDRLTAWDNFFCQHPCMLLLDEHRPELARLRNRLVLELQKQRQEFEEFEKLVQTIYAIGDGSQLSEDLINQLRIDIFRNRLPWLVAAATGELHNGPQRFTNIINKLVYNYDQFSENIAEPLIRKEDRLLHAEKIAEVFRDTKASGEALKKFQNKIDLLKKKKAETGEHRQKNLWADYQVTDRIIHINEGLAALEDELSCRYIVLYLSSTCRSYYLHRDER